RQASTVEVRLRLAKCNRRLSESAVAMHGRVPGVFPPLVCQILRVLCAVAQVISTTGGVKPSHRADCIRPQLATETHVAAPLQVLAVKQQPELRCVNGSVVRRVRDLAVASHLAEPKLVQNTSRLLALIRIDTPSLISS